MTEELRLRIKWSDLEYNSPIRLIIRDWSNLRLFNRRYILINSEMEYKGRKIELCVPYTLFLAELRKLPIKKQKWILKGKAVIEIMKLPKKISHGMVLNNVELYTGV